MNPCPRFRSALLSQGAQAMRSAGRWRGAALAGGCLGLLALPFCRSHLPPTPPARPAAPRLPSLHSPSEVALEEARRWHRLAQARVNQQLETLEAWDPAAVDPRTPERYRQQLIARADELKQARRAAWQAVMLARSRPETCRALRALARIECDLGRHEEELRHAETIVRLSPRDPRSWWEQLHAARCTGRADLEKRADAALKVLGGYPPVSLDGAGRSSSGEPIAPAEGSGRPARRR